MKNLFALAVTALFFVACTSTTTQETTTTDTTKVDTTQACSDSLVNVPLQAPVDSAVAQ